MRSSGVTTQGADSLANFASLEGVDESCMCLHMHASCLECVIQCVKIRLELTELQLELYVWVGL